MRIDNELILSDSNFILLRFQPILCTITKVKTNAFRSIVANKRIRICAPSKFNQRIASHATAFYHSLQVFSK